MYSAAGLALATSGDGQFDLDHGAGRNASGRNLSRVSAGAGNGDTSRVIHEPHGVDAGSSSGRKKSYQVGADGRQKRREKVLLGNGRTHARPLEMPDVGRIAYEAAQIR